MNLTDCSMCEKVGITSTVPSEVVFAAGLVPVDLNNVFINHRFPPELIQKAEEAGFPRNVCSWIKGIFAVMTRETSLRRVIAVTAGDCSNTQALMEVLQLYGKQAVPFDYPRERTRDTLTIQIERLMSGLGASWDQVVSVKKKLDSIRRKLNRLDELTWLYNKVHGVENHLFLVSSSDFESRPDQFEKKIDAFLTEAELREPLEGDVRLGFLGVPPIFSGFYEFVESLGARVVFNEIQRQFSMPYLTEDIVEQYLLYTYPYEAFGRIKDIREAIETRCIHGLIHYTQSFCHRQIEDIIIKRMVSVPVLTIEGQDPIPIDGRLKVRIEAFIDMIR